MTPARSDLREAEYAEERAYREVEQTDALKEFVAEMDRVKAGEPAEGWNSSSTVHFEQLFDIINEGFPAHHALEIGAWLWETNWWHCASLFLPDWCCREVRIDLVAVQARGRLGRRGSPIRDLVDSTRWDQEALERRRREKAQLARNKKDRTERQWLARLEDWQEQLDAWQTAQPIVAPRPQPAAPRPKAERSPRPRRTAREDAASAHARAMERIKARAS